MELHTITMERGGDGGGKLKNRIPEAISETQLLRPLT